MWLPVTITPNGLSNGAPVTGYIIYLDGRQVKEITDPTADSAVINVGANFCYNAAVTMRTKSKDKLSQVKHKQFKNQYVFSNLVFDDMNFS